MNVECFLGICDHSAVVKLSGEETWGAFDLKHIHLRLRLRLYAEHFSLCFFMDHFNAETDSGLFVPEKGNPNSGLMVICPHTLGFIEYLPAYIPVLSN